MTPVPEDLRDPTEAELPLFNEFDADKFEFKMRDDPKNPEHPECWVIERR